MAQPAAPSHPLAAHGAGHAAEASLANDIFYALSMYFADTLKRRLLSYREDGWAWLFLVAMFALNIKLVAAYGRNTTATATGEQKQWFFREIVKEGIRLVNRTMAFLVLQVTIHMVVERGPGTGTSGLWQESIILPFVLLLLGMVVVTLAKHTESRTKTRKRNE